MIKNDQRGSRVLAYWRRRCGLGYMAVCRDCHQLTPTRVTGAFCWLAGTTLALTQRTLSESPWPFRRATNYRPQKAALSPAIQY